MEYKEPKPYDISDEDTQEAEIVPPIIVTKIDDLSNLNMHKVKS